MRDVKELREITSKFKVLFVEDEDNIKETAGDFLRKFFKEVFICNNGEEGLKTFNNNSDIKIVITDIKMPFMDGISMVKEILKVENDIKIAFITASKEEDILLSEVKYTYMSKPVTYDVLLGFIEDVSQQLT